MSKGNRRLGVVINYGCVLIFLASFFMANLYGWTTLTISAVLVFAASALLSFVIVHVRTRLWKMVHASEASLDERQLQITHQSLRHAYGIFTVISLVVLLVLALLAGRSSSSLIVVFACLLYLAHTLPSSILAWTEGEV